MGDHGPEHPVVAHYRLLPVEAGLPIHPVQGLVPDVTQLDSPVGASGDLDLVEQGFVLCDPPPALTVGLVGTAALGHRALRGRRDVPEGVDLAPLEV